jgi:cysteinyl-tRNA synthetase
MSAKISATQFNPASFQTQTSKRNRSAMKAARNARDFKASDTIRAELMAAGIIIEQTKDGIRWRRK